MYDNFESKKVRVLHLGSPRDLYGAERWIISLIKHLDPGRVESLVGAINDHHYSVVPLCTAARELNFPAYVIDAYGRFNLSAVVALKKLISNNEIDIVHTHFYKTDLIALIATLGTRCKVVATPHGWTDQPSLQLRAYEGMSKMIFPFLDAVVPLSEGILKPLRRIPGLRSKLHLIRNAVDIAEAENPVDVAEEMVALRQDGKFIIGFIGRLTPGKGLHTLLDAIAQYSEPQWNVVLVGDGEQSDKLRSLATDLGVADRVHFFGFRADRLAFLRGFDVFVLPSRSEGIPRCLMESMAAEIPMIATDIPGCRNLIDGESTGLLFPVDDSKALANCIKKLSLDEDLRKMLTKNGKAFLREHYSAARMAREYENLYGLLVDAK